MGDEAARPRARVLLRVKFTLTQTLSHRGRGLIRNYARDYKLAKRAGADASQYALIAARLPSAAYLPAMLYHMNMKLIYLERRDLLLQQARCLLYRCLGIN
jgi:hypothetical protein